MCGRNTTKNTSLNFQCICTSNSNTSNFKNFVINVYKVISGNGCNTSNKDCCSSNSNRLRELAEKKGVTSYLIDGAEDIRPEWLEDVGAVGLTAGASAPESLVQGVIERLRESGADLVSEIHGTPENMEFALPKPLRVKLVEHNG